MKGQSEKRALSSNDGRKLFLGLQGLSNRILQLGHLGKPSIIFNRGISRMLMDYFNCDALELRFREGQSCIRCEVAQHPKKSFKHQTVSCAIGENSNTACNGDISQLGMLCCEVIRGSFEPSEPFFSAKGSFWTNDTDELIELQEVKEGLPVNRRFDLSGDHNSLAAIPIKVGNGIAGLLVLKSRQKGFFTPGDIELAEAIAETVGIARAHQQAQAALRERVKELMCLYGIAKLVEKVDISLDEILNGIALLLPPGWQFPEITVGGIVLDGRAYSTADFRDEWQKQSADIVVYGVNRGVVEVAYSEEMPELDEGPFLKEERNLIEAVAIQVGQIIERRKADEDRLKLQDQLRHADRLATIGQLAAGVAHEFNEPLGNVLGFAQLIQKNQSLTDDVRRDIEKIISASMHAREVVKKLMLFARQWPAKKTRVNLNKVVDEGLYFLETRCTNAGIEMVYSLAPDLPDIIADPAQLHQVLVNLVVNAIQAMPDGGTITITTRAANDNVHLIVEDTGTGMSRDVMKQIFLPFFTTKDIDEGTGLGLPVVHGIVTSHGGSISVDSKVGKGAKFEIHLPVKGPAEAEDMVNGSTG